MSIKDCLEAIKDNPLCSFEAKLLFKDYSVSVRRTCQSRELVRFSFTLDAEKGKIKMKIHKSGIIAVVCALVPPQVKSGTRMILAAIEKIQLGKPAAIMNVFNSVFKVLTTPRQKKNADDVTHHDVVIDDEISMEEAEYIKLFTALSTLDLKIRSSSLNVEVDIRKREVLAGIRRKTVILDAGNGLQFKEPRTIFRRAQVQSAVSALKGWVAAWMAATCSKELSVWKFVPGVMKKM